jgi:hypothetical protein
MVHGVKHVMVERYGEFNGFKIYGRGVGWLVVKGKKM